MRRALLVGVTLVATAPAAGQDVLPRTQLEQLLSGFDWMPSRARLEQTLGGDLSGLLMVANAGDPGEGVVDGTTPGMRVRAVRSLGQFDDATARLELTAKLSAYLASDVPAAKIYAIAAIEGLGANGGDAAVPVLSTALASDSRDVRAAAATALADTKSPAACAPLRVQNTRETNPQVRAALQTALGRIDPLCLTLR